MAISVNANGEEVNVRAVFIPKLQQAADLSMKREIVVRLTIMLDIRLELAHVPNAPAIVIDPNLKRLAFEHSKREVECPAI